MKDAPDCIENIVAFCHFFRRKIAGAFRNGGLLHKEFIFDAKLTKNKKCTNPFIKLFYSEKQTLK
jgi:hypothetical protein